MTAQTRLPAILHREVAGGGESCDEEVAGLIERHAGDLLPSRPANQDRLQALRIARPEARDEPIRRAAGPNWPTRVPGKSDDMVTPPI